MFKPTNPPPFSPGVSKQEPPQLSPGVEQHPRQLSPYAKGGRTKRSKMIIAHFNPHELDVLDEMQGKREECPRTGMRSYAHLEELLKNPHILRNLFQFAGHVKHNKNPHKAEGGSTHTEPLHDYHDPKLNKMADLGVHGDCELGLIGPHTKNVFDTILGMMGKKSKPHKDTGRPHYDNLDGFLNGVGNTLNASPNTMQQAPNPTHPSNPSTPPWLAQMSSPPPQSMNQALTPPPSTSSPNVLQPSRMPQQQAPYPQNIGTQQGMPGQYMSQVGQAMDRGYTPQQVASGLNARALHTANEYADRDLNNPSPEMRSASYV